MFEVIVIGCGYAGSIMARKFADDGKKVLVLEKRNHIAGNMYDYLDENGILVHKYGPHIAYMNDRRTYEFLKQYTEFVPYTHHVNAEIDGVEVPLPFNLTAIDRLFDVDEAVKLKQLLIEEYGMGKKVPILELQNSKNEDIKKLANYIFEKVFLHYTMKMWDLSPNEIDPAVTGRVPVHISYDNRHFTSEYQVMPKYGYTNLFKNMLNHENIEIKLNFNALDYIELKQNKIYYNNEEFTGILVYTAQIDELFNYKYGNLPYRSLYFENETHKVDRLQESTVLNWPDSRPATRRTENKLLVCQPNVPNVTSTITEYPGKYDVNDEKWNCPFYPIPHKDNDELLRKYNEEANLYNNLIMIGRLAEYKYYNMEAIILAALDKYNEITK